MRAGLRYATSVRRGKQPTERLAKLRIGIISKRMTERSHRLGFAFKSLTKRVCTEQPLSADVLLNPRIQSHGTAAGSS